MSSTTNNNLAPTGTERSVAGYFKGLSTGYARQTGDSTYNLVHSYLSKVPINELSSQSAIIHDNACGVGTATTAILSLLTTASSSPPPPSRIDATDNSEGMISQLQTHLSSTKDTKQLSQIVHPTIQDSHALPFPDNTFTLSITNISVTNFNDPPECLREIYRTLQPGGRAVVSIWKRFTAAELIHAAQKSIKGPDVTLMKVPKSKYFDKGYLRDRVIEAGFSKENVTQTVETTVVKEEALEGLLGFMKGPLTTSARSGWTEGENERWGAAIDEAVKREMAEHDGGVEMEAWFVTAHK